MSAPDVIEKRVLKELQRLFADPAAVVRRYRLYTVLCLVGTFACAFAFGLVRYSADSKGASDILRFASGMGVGFVLYFHMCAKHALYTAKYCTLDTAAVQQRISEGLK